ncbi:hypothetical protein [Cognatilysobacter bugurensis]|uniref:VCBS repeat-containing protein n=1 Tax=Cognatilysobacter bugurensis TaxID=543356 RepID=A0A918T106_9GAMM|nr:hypothetical protein [Lysobacter bugurensis]GHA83842.1 hypothetical protein GCM10007067_22470 [Lysobacter bugurensis]
MRLSVGLFLLAAPFAALCAERSESNCRASLERAYSVYEMRPASTIRGDFNGDGQDDLAGLMDRKAQPIRLAIGVCLSGEDRPLLIPSQRGLTRIALTVRGSRHADLVTDMTGVFERDALSTTDEDGNTVSYILRAGTFARIAG